MWRRPVLLVATRSSRRVILASRTNGIIKRFLASQSGGVDSNNAVPPMPKGKDLKSPRNASFAVKSGVEAKAQTVLKYETLDQALQDYGDRSELWQNVELVIQHYTRDKSSRPIPTGEIRKRSALLSRQLGLLMHTCVLNEFDMDCPKTNLRQLLQMAHNVTRQFSIDASHIKNASQLDIQYGYNAQDLLLKLLSMQYPGVLAESEKKTLLITANHVLHTWACLAKFLKDESQKKIAAQNAEHLLMSIGEQQQQVSSTLLLGSNVLPDVVSFNIVMTAWSNCCSSSSMLALEAAERSQALLNLLIDLSKEVGGLQPTSISYDILLKMWANLATEAGAIDRTMTLLQEMIANHMDANYDAPTAHTLSHICNILAKANLPDIQPYVQELDRTMESLRIQPSTIYYNSLLMAYYRSKPVSAKEQYKNCQIMNEIVSEKMPSTNCNANRSTLQTVLQAWVDCGRAFYKLNDAETAKRCAEQAQYHLKEALVNPNAGIDIHMIHHIMAGLQFDPLRAEQTLQMAIEHGMNVTTDSYGILLDLFHRATKKSQNNKTLYPAKANYYLDEMLASSNVAVIPDSRCFNAVIFAWVESNTRKGADKALVVLKQFCEKYEQELEVFKRDRERANVLHTRPNTSSFNVAVSALDYQSRFRGPRKYQGPDDLPNLESLLEQMERMYESRVKAPSWLARKMAIVEPNTYVYNILLKLYGKEVGKDRNVLDKANKILAKLDKLHAQGLPCHPDKYTCSSMLGIYDRAGFSSKEIMKFVDKLRKEKQISLTTEFYNILLNLLADRSDEEGSLDAALGLLADMESGVLPEPDVKSYTNLAKAYRNIGTLEAAREAENLCNRWKERTNENVDQIMYNTVIDAYSKLNSAEGMRRAQELLQFSEEENRKDIPNTVTYNTIMRALEARRCQELFDRMMSQYRNGRESVKPDSISFHYLLLNWVRCNAEEAAARAEEVLRLKDNFRSEDPNVFATEKDYHMVLTKWGKHQGMSLENLERAEALLEQWVASHHAGETTELPTVDSYLRVLLNWHDSKLGIAPFKINGVLDRMQARATLNEGPHPDRKCLSIAILALANSGKQDGDAAAEDLLNRMVQLGGVDEKSRPFRSTGSYNGVLRACVHCPTSNQSGTLDRAIRIFTTMKQSSDRRISPDESTYMHMLRVVRRHLRKDDPRRPQVVRELFKDCCKSGYCSKFTLIEFGNVAAVDLYRSCLQLDESTDIGQVKIEDLPADWSRNVTQHTLNLDSV